MKKSLKKTFFGLFIIIPSIFLVFFYMTYNKALLFEEGAFIDVSPGESLNSVISNLEDSYGFDKKFQTKFIMRVLSIEDNITIGRHDLSNVRTVKDLTRNLTSATIHTSITLLEGWSVNEISKYLSDHKDLRIFDGEIFKQKCNDLDFIKNDLIDEMGFYNVKSLEGFLFPETYKVDSYITEEDLIKIFIEEYLNQTKYLREDINDIYRTMIIASIIEAETNNIDEMDTISSVYNNRIKKGMLLQADPTVLYYMTEKDLKTFKTSKPGTRAFGRVWKKYKKMDNPYNTYKYIIPPGPINSPGVEAIKAAINPARTNHLFMVMNNKLGRHLFSDNEKDHLRNIRRN